ncbi:hypothetical protein BGY98DRAFT_934728 [Russula aff. rugulosa BPL654]|nr:hypothetical protein BGY98DRAFT_934728 [Russula aff. rugulosa BPL654]
MSLLQFKSFMRALSYDIYGVPWMPHIRMSRINVPIAVTVEKVIAFIGARCRCVELDRYFMMVKKGKLGGQGEKLGKGELSVQLSNNDDYPLNPRSPHCPILENLCNLGKVQLTGKYVKREQMRNVKECRTEPKRDMHAHVLHGARSMMPLPVTCSEAARKRVKVLPETGRGLVERNGRGTNSEARLRAKQEIIAGSVCMNECHERTKGGPAGAGKGRFTGCGPGAHDWGRGDYCICVKTQDVKELTGADAAEGSAGWLPWYEGEIPVLFGCELIEVAAVWEGEGSRRVDGISGDDGNGGSMASGTWGEGQVWISLIICEWCHGTALIA